MLPGLVTGVLMTNASRVCIYQRFMPPDPSGAGKQAVALAKAVRSAGWQVIFLTDSAGAGSESPTIEGFDVERVEGLPLGAGYTGMVLYWLRVVRRLHRLRHDFDVLHLHSAQLDQLGVLPLVKALRKPVVIRSSMSSEFSAFNSKRGWVRKHLLFRGDAFVAMSQRLTHEFMESGLPASRLRFIPNGVDTKVYRPVSRAQKEMLRRELDLPVRDKILVFHGVFIERKSLHWVIDVIEPYLQQLGVTLLLVGGPAREDGQTGYVQGLRDRIQRSCARERIIVRDFEPAVHRYLQAADAYILASTGEGLPNALLEAMATGLVPFVSRTSGAEDVVEDCISGFLFNPGDKTLLLNALQRLYGPSPAVDEAEISAAAVDRVRTHYSIDETGRRYVDVYESVARQAGNRLGYPAAAPGALVAGHR